MPLFDKLDAWCSSFVIQVPTYECTMCGGHHRATQQVSSCPECDGELAQVAVDVYPNDWH